jgi:DNA-directed RNA polymerase sigma subunit (sigma70/sigma32)
MGEIGKSYNLTKERIRQIEGTALGKMKYPMLKRRAPDFILT